MNKKIIVGSIIAVVILVLVSFTGVVGYQTTKLSTIARASPLFSVRSKRAIDEESRDLTCDYVGKGEESVLSIPKRDDGQVSSQKILEIISNLDEERFDKLVDFIKSKENLFTDGLRDDYPTLDDTSFWVCNLFRIVRFLFSMLYFIPLAIFLIMEKLTPTSSVNCPTSMCKECMTLQL